MLFSRRLFLAGLLGMSVLPTSQVLAAKDRVYTRSLSNLAVSGYDPVAYFLEGKRILECLHLSRRSGIGVNFAAIDPPLPTASLRNS